MLLAGDVGGTKTLLGLFDAGGARPRPILQRAYPTLAFADFGDLLTAFLRDVGTPPPLEAVALGVAGPVVDGHATLTNIGWEIDAAGLAARLGTPRVRLLNDLEAMALSVDVLTAAEVELLQEGTPSAGGNAVVIAAGTGLGQAYLHRVRGRLLPVPSEGGHADFAARTDREMALVRMLRDRFGRAEVEHVLSGPGLVNLHRFTHGDAPCPAIDGDADAAAVSTAALANTCPACAEALDLFVCAFGAEAGNLALRGVATAGVYIGGGIAPKILPALRDGRFMRAFRAKGAMSDLAARMPVKVILNPEAGLVGAAVAAGAV